jgi:hypothetical protein
MAGEPCSVVARVWMCGIGPRVSTQCHALTQLRVRWEHFRAVLGRAVGREVERSAEVAVALGAGSSLSRHPRRTLHRSRRRAARVRGVARRSLAVLRACVHGGRGATGAASDDPGRKESRSENAMGPGHAAGIRKERAARRRTALPETTRGWRDASVLARHEVTHRAAAPQQPAPPSLTQTPFMHAIASPQQAPLSEPS